MRSLMAAVSLVTLLGGGAVAQGAPPRTAATPAAGAAAGAAADPAPDTAPPAPAPDAAPPAKVFPLLRRPDLDHKLQFGFALLPGIGYRAIFPYQENIGCGQTDKRVCSGRLPFFIDVQPSFGFAIHWDVLVDLRFGIEQDFTQTRQFAVAPGFRYWVDPELPVKFFTSLQVAYDITAQRNGLLKHNDDVAFRNSNGMMFELLRNFAFYIQAGETIGFVRWLRFEIDLGVGVQARIP
ncbi:MAG: hypothetical protein QOI66_313 [Myxococcales bacterium]|nr:hypothetical protein [Myxococcales bacterium]